VSLLQLRSYAKVLALTCCYSGSRSAFIIWLVDCRTLRPPARDKAKGTSSFSLLDPDWPEPPINALPYDASRLTAICFSEFRSNRILFKLFSPSIARLTSSFLSDHTVVLQCPKSGVVSPILIVRRIDQATTALGGEPSLGETSIAADVCVPPGERAGDQISQLQKVSSRSFLPFSVAIDKADSFRRRVLRRSPLSSTPLPSFPTTRRKQASPAPSSPSSATRSRRVAQPTLERSSRMRAEATTRQNRHLQPLPSLVTTATRRPPLLPPPTPPITLTRQITEAKSAPSRDERPLRPSRDQPPPRRRGRARKEPTRPREDRGRPLERDLREAILEGRTENRLAGGSSYRARCACGQSSAWRACATPSSSRQLEATEVGEEDG
jgi:hypothetical protein